MTEATESRRFNFAFRPATYWPESPGTRAFLARIKGMARRRIAHEAISSGLPGVSESIFEPALDERSRRAWGGVHPALMGGEYLPDLAPGEVEIARLELASTTADVIAVFARREGDEIHYRVVDEYLVKYVVSLERSRQPLTLGELVALLDQSHNPDWHASARAHGLVEGFWEWHLRAGSEPPEHAVEFVSLGSAFYPGLADYYRSRAEEWIRMSRENPLPPEVVVSLEEGWRRATPEQRMRVTEFLRMRGYERGWFRRYGARDLDEVKALLESQSNEHGVRGELSTKETPSVHAHRDAHELPTHG